MRCFLKNSSLSKKPFNDINFREEYKRAADSKNKIKAFKDLVELLPENTRKILKQMVNLLKKFARFDDNKIGSYALAKVFGPMMFEIPKREELGNTEIAYIEKQKKEGFKFLIDNYDEVFPREEDGVVDG